MANTPNDLALKESNLIAAIEEMLPDFARACRNADASVVIMHVLTSQSHAPAFCRHLIRMRGGGRIRPPASIRELPRTNASGIT